MTTNNRIFLSCVTPEFEKEDAPFAGLRSRLARSLRGARCEVLVQEEFPQSKDDVVLKTAKDIGTCAAVIHLVGALPGSVAHAKARAQYLAEFPDPATPFLPRHPELRAALGDCADLTYTQWEALQGLHHDVPVFVYATGGAKAQQPHLDRLRLGRRFATDIKNEADLLGRLIGDLKDIVPDLEQTVQRIATSRFIRRHTAEIFLGREDELTLLDDAWANSTHVLSVIAWGGVGKTALLSHWIQTRFIAKNWEDADGNPLPPAYFDWSFYDQGTTPSSDERAVRTGSVGDFFEQALGHLGDPQVSLPGKGTRLAGLVRKQRMLFILDGLEPLQQPVGSPTAGRLLDPDLRDFIAALAQLNPGLLVLTSRQSLTDLDGLTATAAGKHDLDDLPKPVAVSLLRRMQIAGTEKELEDASEKFGCHALSLTLLGRYLFDAHGGDIRRIDRVKDLKRADELTREKRKRSAWNVLVAYERWLSKAKAGSNSKTLAVLRLTGLFDRTATAGCLAALREAPVIRGLTDALVGMADDEWNILLRRLEEAHLIKLRKEPDGRLAVDAHPLIREYFAHQLRLHRSPWWLRALDWLLSRKERPNAFRAAHSRLFDHLCTSTPHRPDTLDWLQPLYQAVVHGCLAGRYQEAHKKVYVDRILRGTGIGGFYSRTQLGAIGAELAAVAVFFDEPWVRVTSTLIAADQAWLLGEAAYTLNMLGRLTEAGPPMRTSLGMRVRQQEWKQAAIIASNLCELGVALAQLPATADDARQAIEYADRSGDAFQRVVNRATAADVLHQYGRLDEAGDHIRAAEKLQTEWQPSYDRLYSLPGFRYCDWLLTPVERAAWRAVSGRMPPGTEQGEFAATCDEVDRRATTTLRWVTDAHLSLLDIGLDHLTLSRVGLYRAVLAGPSAQPMLDLPHVAAALSSLRRANDFVHLPRGLLTAALYHFVRGEHDLARVNLIEAQQIAERGPMPLVLADVHLHRARMFRDRDELAKAAKLINELGYGRRDDELADAEDVLGVPRSKPGA